MLLNAFRSRDSCEIEAKFIQNRIHLTEKHLSELSNAFSQYSQKAARIRDKTDEISRVVSCYGEAENLNKSLSSGLGNFADFLSVLKSYGDERVQKLDSKVVVELCKYKDVCKQAKDEVKEIYLAREKELNRKRQLDKIKERNPRNRQQIIQAESELVKATSRVTKSIQNLEEKTTNFEKEKLQDIKSILMNFIAVEVAYHVNSLEVLTKAYDDVKLIDDKTDLEDFQKARRNLEVRFKKSLHDMPDVKSSETPRKLSLFSSGGKFGSLGALFTSKRSPSNGKLSKSDEQLDMRRASSDEDETSDNELDITSSDDEDESSGNKLKN